MNTIPLFSSNLYTYTIDPSSYDKHSIISTVVENYNKSPNRNKWEEKNSLGVKSNLHHYYSDWDNGVFKNVDLGSLVKVYKSILPTFLDNIGIGKELEFNFKINNITVFNDNTQYMNEHHHSGKNKTVFSAVHYLQADETSSPITFTNPSSFFIYPDVQMLDTIQASIQEPGIHNSMFFDYWSIPVVEDQLIIFPAWLKHKVMPTNTVPKKHRIAVVTNISLI